MTCISTFHSYSLSVGQDKVTIADGARTATVGKGSIRLSDHLTLSSTLHVPSLSINLPLMSSLTKK